MRTCTLNYSDANRSLMMKRQNENRAKPTRAEAHVIALLDGMGEKYVFEKGLFNERRFYLIDFYFPRPRKLCLEIDGPCHAQQAAYDAARDAFIRTKRKMRVVRITNKQAMRLDAPARLKLLDDQQTSEPRN